MKPVLYSLRSAIGRYAHFNTGPIIGCLILLLSLAATTFAELTVTNARVTSEKRTGRTEFEYTIAADIYNSGAASPAVTAMLRVNSAGTGVAQGALNFGPIPAGAIVASSSTCIIVQDRTIPFDPAALQWTIVTQPAAPSLVQPPSPTQLTTVPVTGTARPGSTVEIVGGASVVTANVDAAGNFSANIPLQVNRVNKLFATAIGDASERGAPATVDVIQDGVAPSLFIDFPTNGAELTNSSIALAGRVGDMLSGFAGLAVTVNGQPANVDVGIGNNGTFERGGVPLALGPNTITAVATDVTGNSVTKQITVTRVALTGLRMAVVSGDMQQAPIRSALPVPIVVRVLNADGTAFAGKLVTFDVTRSDGRLKAAIFGPAATMSYQTHTDASGYAQAWWILGGDAGCGNNRVAVTSKDIAGTITFCASATPGPLSQINVGSGNNQRVEVNAPAPEKLRAWVSDSCNGIEGVPVTFTVVQGGGKVNGRDSVTIYSGNTGHAEVTYFAGPAAGNQTVEANYPANPGSPATFVTFAIQRDPTKPTTFTGLVLDNTSQPIGGAQCQLNVGGSFFGAITDAQGRFTLGAPNLPPGITDLPSGRADLFVNGLPATTLGGLAIPAGSFPSLSYSPTIVPNAENSLASPVLLPRLNPNNARTYNGTTDLVLTCEGIAGLKMTIKAGSMRKPDGSLVSPANTAIVSLNQVHADNVPMPIPDGAAPPFTWTLQPAQCTFDPPIQVEYPNMSGLPAGSIAYFLTYNHDTEKFEIFASGHVTNDGSTILTDPGAGLSVSGWGCNCPPYSVTGNVRNCCVEAVVMFKGGVGSQDSSVGAGLRALGATLQSNFPGKVFTYLVRSETFSDAALSEARTWLEDQFADCPTRPKTVLIGHSLGGDTVVKSGSIPADYRIALDPIDRAIAFTPPPFYPCAPFNSFYQRGCTLSGPVNLNYLAQDLSTPAEILCALNPIPSSGCLRGFHISGASEFVIAGTDHSSIVSASAVVSGITAVVGSLLPPSALTLVETPGTPAVDLLDESWTLSAGGQAVRLTGDGSFQLKNISAPDQFGPGGPGSPPDFASDDFIRITGVNNNQATPRYLYSNFFQINRRQPIVVNNLTYTSVPPRKPQSLRISVSPQTLSSVGQTAQAQTTAVYADGTTADVTGAVTWTTYRSSNANVAAISGDGLLTARSSGSVYVTATNEGASVVARIFVVPGDPLTTVEGFVRFEDGTPVNAANISLFALPQTAVTGVDGHFVMPNVPTQATSNLTVRATVRIGTQDYVGTGAAVVPVPGGLTDAGVITIKPGGGRLGPIIVSGMDPEEHGTPGRDMIRDIMNFVVTNSAIHQGPTTIVMFGGSGTLVTNTRSIATGLGFTLTQVTGAGITNADLDPLTTPYDVIYMPTTSEEVSGGLTQADLNLINARSAAIITFVNKGGGLAAFSQNLTGGYQWFPLGGLATVNLNSEGNTQGITVTPDGAFILSSSATAVQPFHQGFTGPAGFFGLKVLATQSTGLMRPLIVGGLADILPGGSPLPVLGLAQLDSDGDGVSDMTEIIAGTDRFDGASILRTTVLKGSAGAINLAFPTVVGRTYRVECSHDLSPGSWMTVLDNITGTGDILTVTDPGASGHPRCFYRTVIERR